MADANQMPLSGTTPPPSGFGAVRLAVTSAIGGVVLAGVAFVLVFWDEVLLAAPIIVLVKTLGFWPALLVFCAAWMVMNVISLTIFDRAWEKIRPRLQSTWHSFKRGLGMKVLEVEEAVEDEVQAAHGWRMRIVMWLANVFRPLGAFATGVFLGGPFGAPMYRVLGYKGLSGYLWTIAMTPVYGLVWVSFYGQGGVQVIEFLQENL